MKFKKLTFLSLAFLLSYSTPLQSDEEQPVVILGGGIAALTAAVQISQAGFQPLVISGPSPGGIIVQSHSIRNWPGEIEITGQELADKLQKQAAACGVRFHPGQVVHIDVSKRPFLITVQNPLEKNKAQTIKARTCIVALGALPKLLNVPGEQENLFTNIFTCAPCDGLRFKDKTVAVIGGGDSALTEAHYLSNLAQKVYLIVRSDTFKTIQPKFRDEILARPNVEVLYNNTVESFKKSEKGFVINLATKKGSQKITAAGAFLAIGSLPNTELFKGKLELDKEGYIVLKDGQKTSVEGIYAAGDISDKIFKQATTAMGDATKAAFQAQKDIAAKPIMAQVEPNKPAALKELASVQNLSDLITSSKKSVVVYFYSPGCAPCRSFHMTYDKWAAQFKDKAVFVKVSGDKATDCFDAYKVNAVPSVLVFDSKGKVIHQAQGLKELAELPTVLEKNEQNH